MVQTHGSVQLSMGVATIKGMINVDMLFNLRLLTGADGKPQPPTKTLVKEIFSMMELHEKKVWICLSKGTNGTTTGYFSSVIEEIREHVAAFILCLATGILVAATKKMPHRGRQPTYLTLLHTITATEGDKIQVRQRCWSCNHRPDRCG